jgi:hypothetical protein
MPEAQNADIQDDPWQNTNAAWFWKRQREGIAKAEAAGKYKGRARTAMAETGKVEKLLANGVGHQEAPHREEQRVSGDERARNLPPHGGVAGANSKRAHQVPVFLSEGSDLTELSGYSSRLFLNAVSGIAPNAL